MPEKNKYTIENIYQGGYSTFKPYANAIYFPVGKFAETTNPRTANILKEVSDKLASGTKNVEIEGLSSEVFESIPQQYFKEVKRLTKLTGTDVSVHAPVIDTAGFEPRSGNWSETQREIAEIKVAQALIRSHDIKPDGNVTVNFHSAEGIPGSQFLPPSQREKNKEYRRMIVVNRETGRLIPLETEKEFYPGEEIKERIVTPEERLKRMNATEWDNSISQLVFNKERADEILQRNRPLIEHLMQDLDTGKYKLQDLPEPQREVWRKVQTVNSYLEDIHKNITGLFSKAYENGNEKQKEELKIISNSFGEQLKQNHGNIFVMAKAMDDLMFKLKNPGLAPIMNIPIDQFAVENSSKTFGNAAFQTYKKFKDKSPLLVIENPPAGFALSTGEDIKNIVEGSRKQFVENAVKGGMGEQEAKNAASKLIGATIDVGHINMLKKYGYNDKEIAKEVGKVAPYLKHVHLSDNFGVEHTELPMGMGNVPMKEMLEQLKSKGVDITGMTKVVELNQVARDSGISSLYTTLENIGSPIYSTRVAPYWNQAVGLHQNYFGGYGLMLPQVNYETFGAGFSTLPMDLGGQRLGAQGSRVSGRGME